MRTVIEDIRKKLSIYSYKNEEQIRFSLVGRILSELDWDIWNPQQVATEFQASDDNQDRKRVDVALFADNITPPIYIEIKTADKLINISNLKKAEVQLRDYNIDLTALFTILTDGCHWRFYYSQEGGTFSQKCFKTINLLNDELDDLEFAFLSFLSKTEIVNGNAKREAYEYLQMSRKQRIMEESLANAKRMQDENPLLNLVEALCNVVRTKGIEISQEEAVIFLKQDKDKKRLKAPTETPTEASSASLQGQSMPSNVLETNTMKLHFYDPNKPFSLANTKVLNGSVGNMIGKNWNVLVRLMLRILLNRGISHEDIKAISTLNIKPGILNKNGFNLIPETNYSLQNTDANKAGRAIYNLAKQYGVKVNIEFQWYDKPDEAAYPNEKGKMFLG